MCFSLSSFLMWPGRVRLTQTSEGRLSTVTHSQYLYLLRHLTKEGYFPSKATLMFYLRQGTYLAWDPAMLRSEGCLALQEPGIMGWIGWLSNNLARERKKKVGLLEEKDHTNPTLCKEKQGIFAGTAPGWVWGVWPSCWLRQAHPGHCEAEAGTEPALWGDLGAWHTPNKSHFLSLLSAKYMDAWIIFYSFG